MALTGFRPGCGGPDAAGTPPQSAQAPRWGYRICILPQGASFSFEVKFPKSFKPRTSLPEEFPLGRALLAGGEVPELRARLLCSSPERWDMSAWSPRVSVQQMWVQCLVPAHPAGRGAPAPLSHPALLSGRTTRGCSWWQRGLAGQHLDRLHAARGAGIALHSALDVLSGTSLCLSPPCDHWGCWPHPMSAVPGRPPWAEVFH